MGVEVSEASVACCFPLANRSSAYVMAKPVQEWPEVPTVFVEIASGQIRFNSVCHLDASTYRC